MFTKVSTIAIFILGVHLSLIYNGVAADIMCYECNSYPNNTACKDPMASSVDMITCSGDAYCTKVTYNTQNYSVTSRSCDPVTNDTCGAINRTLSLVYTDLSNFKCYTCQTDHCNSAVTFGVPLVAMLLTLMATKLV